MRQIPLIVAQAEAALRECVSHATVWNASCEQAAVHLASVMVESGIQRREMIRRLRMLGLSRGGSAKLTADAHRTVRDRERAQQDQEFAGAVPVCPHCLGPLTPLDHFCPKCCGPVSANASIDPMGQIYSTGRAYQQAMSGKPRLVVFVGMWMIFGPALPYLFILLCLNLRALGAFGPQDRWEYVVSDGLALDILKLALLCALLVLNSAILWKFTARWVRSRHIAS